MAENTQKDAGKPAEGSGVKESLEQAHEARTSLASTAGLAKDEVVDARLDNRVGTDRPRRESWPAVPQQVDGPDVVHQAEFTKAYLEAADNAVASGSRKGMHSPGPHGLGSEDERVSAGSDDAGDVKAMRKAVKDGYDSRRHS